MAKSNPKTTPAPVIKEVKFLALEDLQLKEDDDGQRTVEGFASVYNNVDSYNDIVLPGAFIKSLKGVKKLPMLWQHDSGQPIGFFDSFEEQKKGLYVKGPILDTTMGNDAHKLVKAGAVTGMSIGYSPEKYEIDEKNDTRKLIEINLYEVSLVTFPANPKAQVTRVKNQLPVTLREFEDFLREAGFDREASTTIALRGFKSLEKPREADQEAIERVVNLLNQFTKR